MKKTKILFEIDLLCKGAQSEEARTGLFYFCQEIIQNSMNKKNFEITICSVKHSENTFKEYLKQYPSLKKLKYFWLGNLKSKARYFCEERTANYKRLGKRTKNVFLKIYYKIIYILFKIIRIFAKFLPNVQKGIDKQLNQFDLYISSFYAIPDFVNRSKNIKKVIFVHDLLPLKFPQFFITEKKQKRNNPIKKFGAIFSSIRPDTLILCDSESTKKDLLEIYPKFSKNEIFVVPLAANKDKFFLLKDREKENSEDWKNIKKSLQKYDIPTDKPYFLSLCSLNPRKNLEFAVDCFVKFIRKNDLKNKINLVLAGPRGWQVEKLLDRINDFSEYKNQIILTGFIDEEDINRIYNGSLAFVYPSLYEGFGLPPLEAMQCGIPIIASNTSSVPEVVGKGGILIDPTNQKELVNAYFRMYTDPDLRKKLISKGIKRAEEFSWEKTVEKMSVSIEKLV